LFAGQNRGAAAVPDRLTVRAIDQVHRQRLDPLFVDLGYRAGKALRRLHQLRGNDPLGTRAECSAAGPEEKLVPTRSEILAGVGLRRDVRQKTREEGAVNGGV